MNHATNLDSIDQFFIFLQSIEVIGLIT